MTSDSKNGPLLARPFINALAEALGDLVSFGIIKADTADKALDGVNADDLRPLLAAGLETEREMTESDNARVQSAHRVLCDVVNVMISCMTAAARIDVDRLTGDYDADAAFCIKLLDIQRQLENGRPVDAARSAKSALAWFKSRIDDRTRTEDALNGVISLCKRMIPA